MEAVLLAVCGSCLALQLLLPGFIGIANNGDFGKVYGRFCLAPRGAETNFVYMQPDYVWRARNFWDSPFHSSENALAWVATRMARATREGAPFDIRWMGAIHSALFLGALAILLAALRKMQQGSSRWTLAATAIVPIAIFTDVCYAASLNSFFMDTAALCALLLMTASALWMAVDQSPRALPLILFSASALLFATSKAQHAVWSLLPAAWLIAWGVRTGVRRLRLLAWSAAAFVLLAGMWMLVATDQNYRGQAMFNVVFYRLALEHADLSSLGVAPEEMRYRGMHSYVPGAPTIDRAWTESFYRRSGFGRLLAWYGRHPRATFGILAATLTQNAPEMRQNNLSNYRIEDGHPPCAQTQRFAAWSNLRSALLRRWPWHIAIWYGFFAAGCLWNGSRASWLGLGIASLGVGEFLAAALGDCIETPRHLFLFHTATDLTLCFVLAWSFQKAGSKSRFRKPGQKRDSRYQAPQAVSAEGGDAGSP